jgi:hypothetical protein
MGFLRGAHHVGTILLFAAVGLLIVADVSAPVVNNLALFRVNLGDNVRGDSITFGTFGYCVRNALGGGDDCSSARIGYNIARVIEDIDGTDFSGARRRTTEALTYVMVLHPVATGLAFIAALFGLFEGVIGGLLTTAAAGLAFIVCAIAVICDFILFSLIRNEVNDGNNSSSGNYQAALWCVLIAAIWCLVGTIIAFFTCCSNRSSSRRSRKSYDKNHWLHGEPAPYPVQSAPVV